MRAAHTPMVVAAARVLCNRMADFCNFDYEDAWKDYGNDFLDDAKAALDAAGVSDLLAALQRCLCALEGAQHPDEIPRDYRDNCIDVATAAVAKATEGAA